jgi:hypothetical protein
VVLADAEDVEPDLIGELDLLDQLLQALLRADRLAGRRVRTDLAECVDSELHRSLRSG